MTEPSAKSVDRVVINWMYHDAGNFWHCPICHESPGYGYNEPGPEETCKKCSSTFTRIQGDESGPNWSPKYGYLCTFRGTPLPKLSMGSTSADDLRAAGWCVSAHFDTFDDGKKGANKVTEVFWRLSLQGWTAPAGTLPRGVLDPRTTVSANAKTDKEALDEIRRKVGTLVHRDNLARKSLAQNTEPK